MNEIVVTKEELVQMFQDATLVDTANGWMLENKEVQIIALHEVDPKYLQDVTNSLYYKIVSNK